MCLSLGRPPLKERSGYKSNRSVVSHNTISSTWTNTTHPLASSLRSNRFLGSMISDLKVSVDRSKYLMALFLAQKEWPCKGPEWSPSR